MAEFGENCRVYLDEFDRKMVLMRKGNKVMRLEQCGIPMDRRFTFFDQVHTTGMDIKQVLNATAVCTLGKDMVFRDYAQGATPSPSCCAHLLWMKIR